MTDLLNPYERVTVGRYSDGRAMVVNRRSKEMLELVEYNTGIDTTITQGSYNTVVAASGGTHDGGGVLDLRVVDYTDSQRTRLLAGLHAVGFIAWYRTPSQGPWPYHIHCVDKGDAYLSAAAKAQVVQANNGTNGLANHAADTSNLNVPTFNWTEYIVMLTDIVNRLAVVEIQVGPTTDARAQYAYKSVTEGGPLENRVTVTEARVGPTTDAHAQSAYNFSQSAGQEITDLQNRAATTDTEILDLKNRVTALEAPKVPTA